MLPNRTFAWDDQEAMRAFAATRAFATIAIAVSGRPMTAWAPLVLCPDGSFRFHLARNNPLAAHLDRRLVLASVLGDHFYVSPDWYGTSDQVPTWNYELVEIEGVARELDAAELADQVDRVSAAQEARLAPKPAWTSAKMDRARFEAMLKGIVGFSIDAPEVRGMRKFNQNKTEAVRERVIQALQALGNEQGVAAMKAPFPFAERSGEGLSIASGAPSPFPRVDAREPLPSPPGGEGA